MLDELMFSHTFGRCANRLTNDMVCLGRLALVNLLWLEDDFVSLSKLCYIDFKKTRCKHEVHIWSMN